MKAAVISPALSIWWKVGALSGASAVLLGAFGAHGLKNRVTDPHLLKNWETAAHYQLIHSVVLLATPMCRRPGLAGGLIMTGTLLFSGSLYAMTLTREKKLGAITVVARYFYSLQRQRPSAKIAANGHDATSRWKIAKATGPSDANSRSSSRITFGFACFAAQAQHQAQDRRFSPRNLLAMTKWWFVATLVALLATPSVVLGACPNKCSGHGKCGLNDVCDCMQNWIGGDCSGRQCPFTRAWHDTAQRDDDAHYFAECGNRGSCDRTSGECTCDSGFVGSGCRRMQCPNDCSGHGTCEYIEELASDDYHRRIGGDKAVTYELWDQEKIMGCVCDGGFEGHDCSLRTCAKGDDPLTPSDFDMIQAIVISSTAAVALGGEGYLTYHDPYGNSYTTEKFTIKDPWSLPATDDDETTCANIQQALRRLPNNVLNTVTVSVAERFYALKRANPTDPKGRAKTSRVFNDDNTAAGASGNVQWGGGRTKDKVICEVAFTSEPGTTGYQHLFDCNVAAHADTKGQQPRSAGLTGGSCSVYEVYPVAVYVGVEIGTANFDLSDEQIADNSEIFRPLTELTECSGRGTCDYATGTCTCFAGHMGLACQKQEALV